MHQTQIDVPGLSVYLLEVRLSDGEQIEIARFILLYEHAGWLIYEEEMVVQV
jgi:hypothetical protein